MSVKKKLVTQILNKNKNINLEKYITTCLFDNLGYYNKSIPIGANGDFITAPEISQLFGEILGLFVYNIWNKNFRSEFNLIELGPGKGTLINDLLRITKSFKLFHNSMNIELIEINPYLKKIQKENLKKINISLKKINWRDDFHYINKYPSIIYANEFFDCLPIRQFLIKDNVWCEKKISYNKQDQRFYFIDSNIKNKFLIKKLDNYASKFQYNENEILEMSPQREKYFEKLCKFIKKNSGIIIVFDYGYYYPIKRSTLQSIINQNYAHILDNPGKQDITSWINFLTFREIAEKNSLKVYNYKYQKDFLTSNGIEERKNKLLSKSNNIQKKEILSGHGRLISDNQMGKHFKCFIASNKNINE